MFDNNYNCAVQCIDSNSQYILYGEYYIQSVNIRHTMQKHGSVIIVLIEINNVPYTCVHEGSGRNLCITFLGAAAGIPYIVFISTSSM